MKGIYTLKQRRNSYYMTVFLLFYVLLGNLDGIVWAQENTETNSAVILKMDSEASKTSVSFSFGGGVSSSELKISDNGISKESVVVTYFAGKSAEGETAHRKVEKLTKEGKILLHEGSINWNDSENSSMNQMSETYSAVVEESADSIYAVDEGVYQVTFCWKDTEGNVIAGSEKSSTFIIDTTVPKATLVCKDGDVVATDAVSCVVQVSDANLDANGVTIVATKATATEVTTENISDKEFANDIEREILFEEEGNYTVYAQVKDLAGNTTTTEPVTFVIDRTKPIVTIDSGDKLNDGIYNTKSDAVILSLKASDYNLVEQACKVEVKKDDKPFVMECQWTGTPQEQTTTLTFDDGFLDGLYTVKVSACDSLGFENEKEFSFIIDNTALVIKDLKVSYQDGRTPNAVVVGEQTTYHLKDTAKVSFLAEEKNYTKSAIHIKTQKDGGVVDEETIGMNDEREKVERTFETEGSYCFSVFGEDFVDNQSETEQRYFVVDKTAPVLEVSQVVDGVESTIGENQLFSVGDNRFIRFSVFEKYHNIDTYQIQIEHRTSGSWVPQVTIIKGSDIVWSNGDSTEEIYFESAELFEKEGQYTVTFTGKDMAGNEAVLKRVSFYIDATAPVIVQTSAVKNSSYYDEAVCFKYEIYEFNYAEAEANITVSRTFDGVTHTTTDELTLSEWNTSFEYWCKEEGVYTITVRAKDYAGNEATQSPASPQKGYTVKFVVDKGTPTLSFSGVDNQYKTRDSVEVLVEAKDRNHDFSKYWIEVTRRDANQEIEHFTISGNATSAYDVEQGWSAGGYNPEEQSIYTSKRKLSFTKEGIYQITIGGKDCAGNEVAEKNITFIIDQTAPSISNVIYSNSKGYLTEKYASIYSKEAILLEFTVLDTIVGVNDQKVYITVDTGTEKTDTTAMYPAHKSLGNRYYVYIPTDLKVEEFTGTITIWAQDLLQNESSVKSSNIIYTVVKPSIQMNCDVDYSKWTNKNVTFQTVVTDEVAGLKQIVYKVNGKTVKKVVFNEPTEFYQYNVTASENASKVSGYAVTVEATNNCGMTQIAKKQVYIDKEKPVVQLSGVQNGVHYRTNQSFMTDVKDVSHTSTKTVYYVTRTLDGKTMPMSLGVFRSDRYEDSCVRKLLREGQYRIYAITTDGAGNMQKSNTLTFVIDKTAPELSIAGTSNGAMSGRAIILQMECVESFYTTNEVKITVEKELDGKTTESEIGGVPNKAKKATLSKTFSEDGTYTVTMTAKDKAGNAAQTKTVNFTVDATKPEIYMNGTDNYQTWKEPTNLQFVVEESYYSGNKVNITGTRRDIDGNKHTVDLPQMINSGKTSSVQQLFEEDGFYEFFVTAEDKAGNKNSKNIHFTIDRTNPEIKGLTQHQGGYYQSFQLAESLEELFYDLTVITYRMLLNGVEYNGTDIIEAEGKYNLYVEVEDELGNTTIENIEFIIDHTPPKIIFSGAKNGEMLTERGFVSLALTNVDDIITCIRMNGKEYSTDIRELPYEEYGAYHIEVDCVDLAGNATTRELHFVYNNPIMVAVITLVMISIIIGICLWLILRTNKEKGKYRHDKSSCI